MKKATARDWLLGNPAFSTTRRPHRYSRGCLAYMRKYPDASFPWSYFDTTGAQVHVTELPLNHPVRAGGAA